MNINLRHPPFIYWSIGCILVGVLAAPLFYDAKPEDHSTHFDHDHSMAHGTIEVDPNLPIPSLDLEVTPDAMSGWNITVDPHNFTFTPENINRRPVANEGHAHIYINGQKLTRLYGKHYHLSTLIPGEYDISVSLNANDHSTYTHNGEPISATKRIRQLIKPSK